MCGRSDERKAIVNKLRAALRDELAVATSALFAGYGIAIAKSKDGPVPSCCPGLSAVARIAFVGKGICGALVLLASSADVERWSATVPGSVSVLDTMGEWANMLVGRLKVALLRAGVATTQSLPVKASTCELINADPETGVSEWISFEGTHGLLHARQDLALTAEFQRQSAVDEGILETGSIEFL